MGMTRKIDPHKGAAVNVVYLMDEALEALGHNLPQAEVNATFKAQLLDTGHLKPRTVKSLSLPSGRRWLRYYGRQEARDYYGPQPYWASCYDGTAAIVRTGEEMQGLFKGKNVYEKGAGSGMAGISAMLYGAKSATVTDADPVAVAAISHNATLNKVKVDARVADAMDPIPDGTNILLAGDVVKDAFLSHRQMQDVRVSWNKFRRRGGTVIVADSYLRMSIPWLADQQSSMPAPVRQYFDRDGGPEADLIILGPL